MAFVTKLILSLGVHPDLPNSNGWRPSHVVGQRAVVELVEIIFSCRPDMTALVNLSQHTPYDASTSTYVSIRRSIRVASIDDFSTGDFMGDDTRVTRHKIFCETRHGASNRKKLWRGGGFAGNSIIMVGQKFLTNLQMLWQRVMANTLASKKL
jgi:hypothetical protein